MLPELPDDEPEEPELDDEPEEDEDPDEPPLPPPPPPPFRLKRSLPRSAIVTNAAGSARAEMVVMSAKR